MIEIIKAEFFPGEIKTFNIQGEYLEILECAYPITVVMLDRNGVQLSVMRNAEASYFSRPGKYETIQITSQDAQTIRLFVGSGDAGTRKTSGVVTVIDGYKNMAHAGDMYIGMAYSPPSGGSRPYTQLWNPVTSNKILVVGKISSSWQGSGNKSLNIYFDTNQFIPTGLVCNKKSGGGTGVGALRQKRDIVAPDYIFGGIWSRFLETNQLFEWKSENGPIIVMPGYGLSVFGDFPDVGLMTGFEWYEEEF